MWCCPTNPLGAAGLAGLVYPADTSGSGRRILASAVLDGTIALRGGVRGHFFWPIFVFNPRTGDHLHNVVKVPNSLPLELLAPLACGIQTCALL